MCYFHSSHVRQASCSQLKSPHASQKRNEVNSVHVAVQSWDSLIQNTLETLHKSFCSELKKSVWSVALLENCRSFWRCDFFFFILFFHSTHVNLRKLQTNSESQIFSGKQCNSMPRLYPGVWRGHSPVTVEEAEFRRYHLVPLASVCQVLPSLWRSRWERIWGDVRTNMCVFVEN